MIARGRRPATVPRLSAEQPWPTSSPTDKGRTAGVRRDHPRPTARPPRTGSPGAAASLCTRFTRHCCTTRRAFHRTATPRTHSRDSPQRREAAAALQHSTSILHAAPSRREGGSDGHRCTGDARRGRALVRPRVQLARRLITCRPIARRRCALRRRPWQRRDFAPPRRVTNPDKRLGDDAAGRRTIDHARQHSACTTRTRPEESV